MVRDVRNAPHLATALEFWLFQGCTGDWGLSRAACGKVGSAHEHFCDEMKVVRFLMGTGGVYEVGE